MTDYFMVFHGGGQPAPEDQEQAMKAWMDWYASMGDAVVWEGGPAGMSKTVASGGVTDDGGSNPTTGVSVVRADSIEAACEMAKGCPMVKDGSGSVEIAPMMAM